MTFPIYAIQPHLAILLSLVAEWMEVLEPMNNVGGRCENRLEFEQRVVLTLVPSLFTSNLVEAKWIDADTCFQEPARAFIIGRFEAYVGLLVASTKINPVLMIQR